MPFSAPFEKIPFLSLIFWAGIFLVSALFVFFMQKIGIPDIPDDRKNHILPMPKSGGAGPVIAFTLGFLFLNNRFQLSALWPPYANSVLIAALIMAFVSLLDDIYNWPFTVKLAAQVCAVATVIAGGLYLSVFAIPDYGLINIGLWGIIPTFFLMIFLINAVNFIDGLNGLAGGIIFITALFVAVACSRTGDLFGYISALLLGAGILGFLPFNFPRCRIFMGDVGSQFCGFILAVLCILTAHFTAVDLSFLIVPGILSGVIFDVGFTLLRRLLARENITQAHRGHLFQIAVRSGMSPALVTLIYWGFTLFGGGAVLLFLHQKNPNAFYLLPVLLFPQLLWLFYIWYRAKKTGITNWSGL